MFEGRKANKCKRYNLPHILNGGVQCGVSYKGILSLPESQHTITLVTPRHFSLYLFQETALLLPTLQSEHKTFSWVIVTQILFCIVTKTNQP